jgi:hypothetical protein
MSFATITLCVACPEDFVYIVVYTLHIHYHGMVAGIAQWCSAGLQPPIQWVPGALSLGA